MIERPFRIRCDRCGKKGQEARKVDHVRAWAEMHGWATLWHGGDHYHFCPDCVAGKPRRLNPPRGRHVLPDLAYLARQNPEVAAIMQGSQP